MDLKFVKRILTQSIFLFVNGCILCVRFRLKSGNVDHPGDIITNATVEVLPSKDLAAAITLASKLTLQLSHEKQPSLSG